MGKHILAIDQGTGGTKTVLFNAQGEVVGKAAVPLQSVYPQVGFVEQDPLDLFENVLASLRQCVDAARQVDPQAPERIAAVGISNQRETFVLWDTAGNPICNAVVWQCKRSVPICERLKGTRVEAEVRARTGLIIDPYFSGAKLTWLMENDPSIRDGVKSGQVYFGTVDTWILFKLTRGRSYCTDYTNASRTLLFNIHSLSWDDTLIEAFGAKGLLLPEVFPSAHVFGESDFEALFPKPIPIAGMIGDSHAAAFGQGCFTPGEAKATLGTGSSILCNIGSRPSPSTHGMVTTICWATQSRIDYALEGIIVTCGATVKWLRDQLGLMVKSADTESMAMAVEDNGGVYLIPAFSGMGAPHWKMDARAAIVGLTFGANKNHVARAALESVAFQIKDVIEAMGQDSGTPLAELKVDGGMTGNRLLMQLVADLLEVRVVASGLEEVSALGAAYMAGLGIGAFDSLADFAPPPGTRTFFDPSGTSDRLKEDYRVWGEMIAKHC
ncbi:MAG: glycerol kinase GlpK [Desulfobacterales bacterium]|nr:glycerol kinase GlpK [Desulfobacterales bacterium]